MTELQISLNDLCPESHLLGCLSQLCLLQSMESLAERHGNQLPF